MDQKLEQQLKKHLKLVIEANKTTNITRIDSFDEGMRLHVEDSLAGLPEVQQAPEGKYADIGTGAGYPGIPLALATGRNTLLVDSVGKKTAILDGFIEELGLDNTSTYTGRIEDLAREHAGEFSLITARALSQLSILMELASPLLAQGGYLVCYKGDITQEELDHALGLQNKLGMRFVSDRAFNLGEAKRHIIVFEKASEPQINLPRKTGFAQKKPL